MLSIPSCDATEAVSIVHEPVVLIVEPVIGDVKLVAPACAATALIPVAETSMEETIDRRSKNLTKIRGSFNTFSPFRAPVRCPALLTAS